MQRDFQSSKFFIQGYQSQADFYILLVATCPVVLGVQWMATLGPIQTDYNNPTMVIQDNGKPVILQDIEIKKVGPPKKKECNLMLASSLFLQEVCQELSPQLATQRNPIALPEKPTRLCGTKTLASK